MDVLAPTEHNPKVYQFTMIREDKSIGSFLLTDYTVYPDKSKTYDDFSGFLHAIKHTYTVNYFNGEDWIKSYDYQEKSVLKLFNKFRIEIEHPDPVIDKSKKITMDFNFHNGRFTLVYL